MYVYIYIYLYKYSVVSYVSQYDNQPINDGTTNRQGRLWPVTTSHQLTQDGKFFDGDTGDLMKFSSIIKYVYI